MATRSLVSTRRIPDAADVNAKVAEVENARSQIAQARQLAVDIKGLSESVSRVIQGGSSGADSRMFSLIASAQQGASSVESALHEQLEAARNRPVIYHVEETWNVIETFYTQDGKEYTQAHYETTYRDEVGVYQVP